MTRARLLPLVLQHLTWGQTWLCHPEPAPPLKKAVEMYVVPKHMQQLQTEAFPDTGTGNGIPAKELCFSQPRRPHRTRRPQSKGSSVLCWAGTAVKSPLETSRGHSLHWVGRGIYSENWTDPGDAEQPWVWPHLSDSPRRTSPALQGCLKSP